MNGINKAIKTMGSIKTLSEKVGVTYEAVRQWKHVGLVPQGSVFDVEDATGVPCYELNPVVYPSSRFKADSQLKQAS